MHGFIHIKLVSVHLLLIIAAEYTENANKQMFYDLPRASLYFEQSE